LERSMSKQRKFPKETGKECFCTLYFLCPVAGFRFYFCESSVHPLCDQLYSHEM
jgi:hypothetical protein